MSYVVTRREEEKERRRGEILDAAEALYAKKGWDALTVDQVARSARLSRALVYVYFKDKEDLLFAIGERAMRMLSERFIAASETAVAGMNKVESMGRAYMGYAFEFPHYFDFCSRYQSHASKPHEGTNEDACRVAGDRAIDILVRAIQTGISDGSIRADIGDPKMLAMSLKAFTHGIIQIAMTKGADLAHHGIATAEFSQYAFSLLRRITQHSPTD